MQERGLVLRIAKGSSTMMLLKKVAPVSTDAAFLMGDAAYFVLRRGGFFTQYKAGSTQSDNGFYPSGFSERTIRPFQGNNHPSNETKSRRVGESKKIIPGSPILRLSDSLSWIGIFPEWPNAVSKSLLCNAASRGVVFGGRKAGSGVRRTNGAPRLSHSALRYPQRLVSQGSVVMAQQTL